MPVTRTLVMTEGPIRAGTWTDPEGRSWKRRGELLDKHEVARLLRSSGAHVAMFWGGELWYGPAVSGGALPPEIGEVVAGFAGEAVKFADFRCASRCLVVIEINC